MGTQNNVPENEEEKIFQVKMSFFVFCSKNIL